MVNDNMVDTKRNHQEDGSVQGQEMKRPRLELNELNDVEIESDTGHNVEKEDAGHDVHEALGLADVPVEEELIDRLKEAGNEEANDEASDEANDDGKRAKQQESEQDRPQTSAQPNQQSNPAKNPHLKFEVRQQFARKDLTYYLSKLSTAQKSREFVHQVSQNQLLEQKIREEGIKLSGIRKQWDFVNPTTSVKPPPPSTSSSSSSRRGVTPRPHKIVIQFQDDDYEKAADVEEHLVPIRIDAEHEGVKIKDTLLWNLSEPTITPRQLAELTCLDMNISLDIFAPIIEQSIIDQVEDYRAHSLELSYPKLSTRGNGGVESPEETIRKENGELRMVVKLDIVIGNLQYEDQIEWDMASLRNKPELLAQKLVEELDILYSLGPLATEFESAISHSIREQVQNVSRTLLRSGGTVSYTDVPEDLRGIVMPPMNGVRRQFKDVVLFQPRIYPITQAEMDRQERGNERDNRSKRRQTKRSRRAPIEFTNDNMKTSRTPLSSTSGPLYKPYPRTRQHGHYNWVGVDVKPEVPTTQDGGKKRLSGRKKKVGLVEGALSGQTDLSGQQTNINAFMVHVPPTSGQLMEGTIEPTGRRRSVSIFEGFPVPAEWRCDACGCDREETRQFRRGPYGPKTLCNTCGVKYCKSKSEGFQFMTPFARHTSTTLMEGNSESVTIDEGEHMKLKPIKIAVSALSRVQDAEDGEISERSSVTHSVTEAIEDRSADESLEEGEVDDAYFVPETTNAGEEGEIVDSEQSRTTNSSDSSS